MNKWLEWMHSDEYAELSEAEDKALAEHWANDLLDAPHALIAMIETKIARAEIQAEKRTEERIIKLLEKHNCVLDGSHHSENLCTSPHHLGLLIALIKGEQK
jgi:formylmethanofuran dehydrogenase subunit E